MPIKCSSIVCAICSTYNLLHGIACNMVGYRKVCKILLGAVRLNLSAMSHCITCNKIFIVYFYLDSCHHFLLINRRHNFSHCCFLFKCLTCNISPFGCKDSISSSDTQSSHLTQHLFSLIVAITYAFQSLTNSLYIQISSRFVIQSLMNSYHYRVQPGCCQVNFKNKHCAI